MRHIWSLENPSQPKPEGLSYSPSCHHQTLKQGGTAPPDSRIHGCWVLHLSLHQQLQKSSLPPPDLSFPTLETEVPGWAPPEASSEQEAVSGPETRASPRSTGSAARRGSDQYPWGQSQEASRWFRSEFQGAGNPTVWPHTPPGVSPGAPFRMGGLGARLALWDGVPSPAPGAHPRAPRSRPLPSPRGRPPAFSFQCEPNIDYLFSWTNNELASVTSPCTGCVCRRHCVRGAQMGPSAL